MNGVRNGRTAPAQQKRQHMTLHPMQLEAVMAAIIAGGYVLYDRDQQEKIENVSRVSRRIAKEIIKQIKEDMPL